MPKYPNKDAIARSLRLDPNWLIVAGLSAFAWAPLLYPGFFQSGSGLSALYRVAQPDAAAAFFPAGAGDAAPLAFALARLLHLLGLDALAAVRAVYGLALLGSGLAMYLCARRLLGAAAGLVAALVYTYLPVTIGLVYVRGALSEAAFLALLPLTLWTVDWLVRDRSPRRRFLWPVACALGGPLLALAHPGLTLAALPVLVAFAWRLGGPARAFDALMMLAAGAALAVYSLLPPGGALPAAAAAPQGIDPYRFFAPDWRPGPGDPPFQLGVAAVILAILAISELFLGGEQPSDAPAPAPGPDPQCAALGPAKRQAASPLLSPRPGRGGPGRREVRAGAGGDPPSPFSFWEVGQRGFGVAPGLTALCLALLLLLLAIMTPPGAALWGRLGLQAVLPQPWMLLAVAALPLALLAGSALAGAHWGPMLREPLTLAAVLAAVLLASYPYLAPRTIPAAALPDTARPPSARFQDGLVLAGIRFDQPAGQRVLRVTMAWQALAPVGQDYTIFTHLVDGAGKQVGQKDARPQQAPTNTWLPGEVVSDTIEIALAPEVAPGKYTLDVGLYVLATGQRAALAAPSAGATHVSVPVEVH